MSLLHSKSYNGLPISLSIAAKLLLVTYKVQVTITFLTVNSYSLSLTSHYSNMLPSIRLQEYTRNIPAFGPLLYHSAWNLPLSDIFFISGYIFHLLLYLVQHYNHPISPFFSYSMIMFYFFHSTSYPLTYNIIYFLMMFMVYHLTLTSRM